METRLLPSTHHILDINIFVGEGNNDTNMCMRVCVRMCVHTHSVMSDLSRLQAPLSIEFSMQEYWSGLPFPTRGHLPDPGIEPGSSARAGRFLTAAPPGKPLTLTQKTVLLILSFQ